MTYYLKIPKKIEISDTDICIVFGNCLENAIEACRRSKDGKKFVNIKSEPRGNMLIFVIDNSFDVIANMEGDTFLLSNRNGQGMSISSVKAVVNRYDGTSRFEALADIFRVSVMLQNARNPDDGNENPT